MHGLIGKTVGRYQIVEHLGRGGMAEVYKAYQPSLDRYVAIKLMHAFLADDQDFLTRFEREAKVVATLRHPNIVQVYDFDLADGQYFMVMEFIDGVTLKTMLEVLQQRGEWMGQDDAVRIILSVGSALAYAHERKMVHRDVKPANVMITHDGHVILTDFGIAKILSATHLTASGAMVGTPSYMAPEQGMGEPGDERSDIYSLGVMLYQLAVGRLPYDADTPLAVVLKHINDPLPIPRALKPDLSEDVERVILKALAKSPADRYQHVTEMTDDLRHATGVAAGASPPDAAKPGSVIKMSGATIVGRVGAATPKPGTPAPASTVAGSGAAATVARPAAGTVVGSRPQEAPAPVAQPAIARGRPRWIIPVIVVAVLVLGGGGVFLAANSGRTPSPTPTMTLMPTQTVVPTATEFSSPDGVFKSDNVEIRSGPAAGSQQLGRVGLSAGKFQVLVRSSDSKWLKIEFVDHTTGWVPAEAVDLDGVRLDDIPQAPTVSTLTPTPTSTLIPTDTPTSTPIPTNTATPVPTKPTATRAPATATRPPAPTATPTSNVIPLTLGFEVASYDPLQAGNRNWTATVRLFASGGDGKYHYYMPNPDTGNWDERVGPDAYFIIRWQRCKIWLGEMRAIDESGHSFSQSYSIDPPPGCTLP